MKSAAEDKLEGRRVFVWRGPNDAPRLAEVIAEAAAAEIFNLDGNLVFLDGDQPVPINKDILQGIISRHIISVRLENRGSFEYRPEYFSLEFPLVASTREQPDQKILLDLINILT